MYLLVWINLFLCVFSVSYVYSQQNETVNDQSYRIECSEGTDSPAWECRKKLIEGLFSQYDARLAPTTAGGGSTNVSVQIYILSIDSISETNMDFSTSMYLRQSWHDSRLVYTPIEGMRSLELDSGSMLKVWIPDLHIPSEKKALVHQVTVPNKLMHVYPDGKIQYSLRISATIKCNFDLRKFPLDTQHCVVEMESYGYTTDTLRFEWDAKSVSISKNMRIPQFFLQDLTTAQCDKSYYGVSYSCVSFEFSMKRSQGYYITQVFIPSYLIVFLSWVSFWLDIDAVPARISLGLLTVLTMTTQSAGSRNNLPKVSYLKAIDVWMASCLGFVFLALVQFAYVNVLSRVEKRRKSTAIGTIAVGNMMAGAAAARKFAAKAKPPPDPETLESPVEEERTKSKSKFLNTLKNLNINKIINEDREKARTVDRLSRYLFPAAFLLFNIVYWCVYVLWDPSQDY